MIYENDMWCDMLCLILISFAYIDIEYLNTDQTTLMKNGDEVL